MRAQNEQIKLENYTKELRVCTRVKGGGAGEGSAADYVRSTVVASV